MVKEVRMFTAFKKEIMIIFFTAISFLLGSFSSSNALNEPQEELGREEEKDI